MRLLVTGGAGFIGSNFIRRWLESHPEDTVINLDALTYAGNPDNIRGLDERRHQFIRGNICDAEAVRRAMESADVVVHFAAESHVDRSIQDGQIFLKTNVMGTHVLLEEARRRGGQIQRFHLVSTDEVFGSLALNDKRVFDETSPYQPRSPYAASKAAADHLCRAYFYTFGLPVTVSHGANTYGPFHFPEKFIPLTTVNALRDLPVPIYGDGLSVRDWIHVDDHVRGIETVLTKGRVGESYCLAGNAERANIDVAKKVLDILGKPHSLLSFVEDRKGHDRRYAMNGQKALLALDWSPTVTFDDGLRETVAWFKTHEAWWRPLLSKTI